MASVPREFGTTELAEFLGCGRTTILAAIRAGRLAAMKTSKAVNGRCPYRIRRDAMIRWLVADDFPLDLLRRVLNPGGSLYLVGCDPALQAGLTRVKTVAIASLFDLGSAIGAGRCWGAVVNLDAFGADRTTRELASFSAEHDRPELIGLYGPEMPPTRVASVFDVLLPDRTPVPTLARAIYLLRPGEARPCGD